MKNLAKAAITTGAGNLLYTAPNAFRADIQDIVMSNTTAAAISLKIHLVPAGGSVADSNMMVPNVAIPGNTFIQWTGNQTLEPGGFIQGIGSSAGISVTINGDEHR